MDADAYLADLALSATEWAAADDVAAYRSVALGLLAGLLAGHGDAWRQRSACRGMDPNLFHRRSSENAASAVCARCPVQPDCLAWAMSLPADQDGAGIHAGLNVTERRALRRRAAA